MFPILETESLHSNNYKKEVSSKYSYSCYNKDKNKEATNNKTKTEKKWYWGINNNAKTHCSLLEMVFDSLNNEDMNMNMNMNKYKHFIKKNITNLCLEVGNMSDFFEQLNYITMSNTTPDNKINNIMNLRDHTGNKFINKKNATIIYNTMAMNYVKHSIVEKYGGNPNENENCYRKISKGKIGLNVDKCSSNDPESCKGKVEGCKKSNCSREDPDNPGLHRNISDMKKGLYNNYKLGDTKETSIIEGRCLTKKDLPEFKFSNYKDNCNVSDLNELCNYYESNPDQSVSFLKDTQDQYINSDMPNCSQMLGDFNKSRDKQCKTIKKKIEKDKKTKSGSKGISVSQTSSSSSSNMDKSSIDSSQVSSYKLEDRDTCYRQISKGKVGYNVNKCSSDDSESCKEKVEGCKKANCSIEDPENPGLYRNISDMKKGLYNLHNIDATKDTSILEGKCLSKNDLPNFKFSNYRDNCNVSDLNELCDYYEANPDESDSFLKNTQEQYIDSNSSNCSQMIGDFNKSLKGKSREKQCKTIKKKIKKDQEHSSSSQASSSKSSQASSSKSSQASSSKSSQDPSNTYKDKTSCYRQVEKGKLGYNVSKCSNDDSDSCKEKVDGCKKSNCSIEDPQYPGLYRNISDMKKGVYNTYNIEDTKETSVLEGKCLNKKDLLKFKLSNYRDTCNIDDLNELCNYYDANPEEIDKFLKNTQEQYIDSNIPNCSQMLGDFNRLVSGKARKKQCKLVKKTLDKKEKKDKLYGKLGKFKSNAKEGLGKLSEKASDMKNKTKEGLGKLSSSAKDSMANMKESMSNIEMGDINMENIDLAPVLEGVEGNLKNLSEKLGSQLLKFNAEANNLSSMAIDKLKSSDAMDDNSKQCLPNLPKMIFPAVLSEFDIPLNINDVLLIGFSVFPYIGWIFDIFMIFRALLEKRWVYAILMTINWYQWFIWKLLTFGTANIDIGPVFKLFYMGPYASKYFNVSNVSVSFLHFINELTGNMPKMLTITN